MKRVFLWSLMVWLSATAGLASASPDPSEHDLLSEIRQLDERIFEAAFLTCDAPVLRALMSEDLEFYHDLYGLIANDLDAFLAGTIPDCIARSEGTLPYIERRPEPGTLQVRRLGDWGALQTGSHTFHGRDEDNQDLFLERGTFMHVWERSELGWRIKRVISYDHESE